MRVLHLDEFTRGWFIGNFDPSIIKTDLFEIGLLTHKKGEYWAPHYHKEAIEYNLLLDGQMELNGVAINRHDIFIIERSEVASPIFLEDCRILVVKVPSIIGDKYNVV